MATVGKLVRVANPRRKRIKVKRRSAGTKRRFRNRLGHFVKRKRAKARNPRRTKAHTGKRHYKRKGKSTRRKTGLVSALRTELRRLGLRSNPGRRKARKKRPYRRSRRVSNPVLIELGAVNPRRKRSHMAKRRKKYHRRRNPRRVARRRNAPPAWAKAYGYRGTRPAMARNRRRNGKRRVNRRHRHYSRRRNPAVFGRSSGKDLLMMTGGVLVGVAATKYLPTLVPASLLSTFGTNAFISVIVTGAGAFVAGMLARKVSPGAFADAVLLGGLAQTASAALNAFAPPTLAGRLALSGVGDIIPGSYVVPQNPIKAGIIPMPTSAGMGAFRGAFGGRR